MRSAVDEALNETVERMISMRTGECSVALKIKIELAGMDEAGRKVPEIHYTVSSSIPVKQDAKFRISEPLLIDEGPDGLVVIQRYEQTSMVE